MRMPANRFAAAAPRGLGWLSLVATSASIAYALTSLASVLATQLSMFAFTDVFLGSRRERGPRAETLVQDADRRVTTYRG
jgi:hypothetical protein